MQLQPPIDKLQGADGGLQPKEMLSYRQGQANGD